MAAAASLVRSARCHSCRHDVLRSFVRVSGLTIAQTSRSPQMRQFFTTPNLKMESSNHHTSDRDVATELHHDAPVPNESANSSQDVPWYLQVEPVIETTHPIARQQQIPDVPENAPSITREILQHLSLEIGLDDMVLLDLRGRDPLPALGGNVIMVIGSARGVKHLNVSADRFCRWLRSTYKLRPYADGLLGRNELKIKLRRKARRARLASSAGTTADTSDDGITTGWICVNIGSVDDPSVIQNMREGGFEGFGKVQGGTRIVVQMFTEEKRADVDLEQLWAPKKDVTGPDSEKRSILAEEDYQVRLQSSTPTEHKSNQPMSNVPRPPPRIDLSQRRNFSTVMRQKSVHTDVKSGSNYDTADVGDELGHQERQLSAIFQTINGLSPDELIEQLGSGPQDMGSTELLRDCYSFAGTDSNRKSTIRLMLSAVAVSLQHPGYTKEYLWKLFLEQTASGYRLSELQAFEIASAFLVPRLESQEQKRTISELVDFDIESAMRVMDNLSLSGETIIMKHRLYNMMYRALLLSLADGNANKNNARLKALRIRTLMDEIGLEWQGTDARETMQLRLLLGDVDGFYEIWHAIAFNEGSRTADDYEVLFRVHAEAGNAAHARECLAVWISMMGRENPPVQPDAGIISAIAKCAYVAGQHANTFRLSLVSNEWEKAQPLIVEEMRTLEQLS
ncbi:ATPase synthesis protein 25 mitochondrial [Talaromyces marneffei ATCC 18224]|uniref:uncharacterized protein n=1 Tax=Talaromyces marneffei TaxID=37727 RepID=UPI0012A8D678|nr:uncharacterized protein EYB26_002305 [Talaromyces marneffei]KAE8555354.1 hypothetical protein EYB25_000049 [Talaromyces marneffei]QGA14649.1 hypothetical protein EYB26_002305 [Talaromyces marneffei]